MPLITRLFNLHPWEALRPSRRLLDWHLDHYGLTSRELNALMEIPRWAINPRFRAEIEDQSDVGKDGFQVSMDVKQFKPNEISVKTVDNSVIIEGKHEERRDDHGFITRHFIRKYSLPTGYDPNKVVSMLTSDGVLTITAPLPKPAIENKNERVVKIQTGPGHVKDTDVEENKEEINTEADKEENKNK